MSPGLLRVRECLWQSLGQFHKGRKITQPGRNRGFLATDAVLPLISRETSATSPRGCLNNVANTGFLPQRNLIWGQCVPPMGILERYIFRTAFSAFLLCLVALTAVIWMTTALRELDLVTGKGQTIFMFIYLTLLSIPALIMVITPLALFIAIMYTLNKLNGDSELIVMSAAGIPPRRVLRPFFGLTILATVMMSVLSVKVMPDSFRELRQLITKIRAEVVTQFVQEGKFITIDQGVTFHYREKAPNGTMRGIMFHDRRNPKMATTYLAERGRVAEIDKITYFILEKGSFQRQDPNQKETALVYFDRYAIDLDQLTPSDGKVLYKPREWLTSDLLFVDPKDPNVSWGYGRFRAELHERFSQPLFGFAILAIAFAALGTPRTTRQGRGAAMGAAALAIVILRIAGFFSSSLAVRNPIGIVWMYGVPLAATGLAIGFHIWSQKSRKASVFGFAAILQRLIKLLPPRLVGLLRPIASLGKS